MLCLLVCLCKTNLCGQLFTRITNTMNPIVTDAYESGGGSWVDINNDSLLDLFVANGNLSNQNNSLYRNTGNGNFVKVTSGAIVNDGGSSIGSTWGDYDNDGFLDCFVTNRNNFGNFLYHGNGDTVFTKITTGSVVTSMDNSNSSSWVDVDNDGDLDLYVVNFQAADFFYINSGVSGFTLSPITHSITSGTNFSIPGAWGDYNNDLYADLFIGNSGTQNDQLFTNNGNLAFTSSSFSDGKATLGSSWGDYDNDGDLDLFVTNFLSHGNILYQNSGAPAYSLTPVPGSIATESASSVGSAWGDLDNDGDLDLYVGNDGQNNFLYLNNGFPAYSFTKVLSGQVVNDGGNSFGCVFGDYDNDGQLDIFVANRLNQQNFLYHNNGTANNWITVKCTGVASNKSAIGTKVYVKSVIGGNPTWQMQEIEGQTGYNSQNLWLHFGLGDASLIDTMKIKWPSGKTDTCYAIPANQFYAAIEGACHTVTIITTGIEEFKTTPLHFQNYPNPFTGQTTLSYSLAQQTEVTIEIYDLTGRFVQGILSENQAPGIKELIVKPDKLAPGYYYFKLKTKEGSATRSFIYSN